MDSNQAWAIIGLLTLLNVQHINLKEKFGEFSAKVRKLEDFLADQLGYKTQ